MECESLLARAKLHKLQDAWVDHIKFNRSASKNDLLGFHKSFERVIDKCLDYKWVKIFENYIKTNGESFGCIMRKHHKKTPNPFPNARAQEFESSKENHMEKAPNKISTKKVKKDHSLELRKARKACAQVCESFKEKHMEKAPEEIPTKEESVEPVCLALSKALAELKEERTKYFGGLASCHAAYVEAHESFKNLKKAPNSFLTKIVEYAEQLAICEARSNALEKVEAHALSLSFRQAQELQGAREDNSPLCYPLVEPRKVEKKETERFVARCNALRKEIEPEEGEDWEEIEYSQVARM